MSEAAGIDRSTHPFGRASGVAVLGTRLRHLAAHGAAGSAVRVFALRVVGAALSYLSTLVLVRLLGPADFGIYAQMTVAAALLGLALPLGLNGAALRFIPAYRERGRSGRLQGVISVSRAVVAAASLAFSLVAAGLLLAFRDAIPEAYFLPLLLAVACLPLLALLDLYESFARGFGWAVMAYAPPYVLMPVATLAALLAAVSAGWRPDAAMAMAAFLVATALALAVLAVAFRRRAAPALASLRAHRHTRVWVMAALPLMLVETSRALMDHTDILMLGALASPEGVAAYFAAARTAGLLGFIGFSVGALAVPRYAALHAAGERAALQDFVRATIHLGFWPTFCGVAALAIAGRPILVLFDPAFAAAYPALMVLALGWLVKAAAGPVEYLLNAGGEQRAAGGIYLAGALANLVLNAALIPPFGLIGAAVATSASVVVVTALLVWQARRRMGVRSLLALADLIGRGTTIWREAR